MTDPNSDSDVVPVPAEQARNCRCGGVFVYRFVRAEAGGTAMRQCDRCGACEHVRIARPLLALGARPPGH